MEIEEYLRKFEPAPPPPELKARACARRARPRVWPFFCAAAAALAILWAVNRAAEMSLEAALDRGARTAPAEEAGQRLAVLEWLRKEMQ